MLADATPPGVLIANMLLLKRSNLSQTVSPTWHLVTRHVRSAVSMSYSLMTKQVHKVMDQPTVQPPVKCCCRYDSKLEGSESPWDAKQQLDQLVKGQVEMTLAQGFAGRPRLNTELLMFNLKSGELQQCPEGWWKHLVQVCSYGCWALG